MKRIYFYLIAIFLFLSLITIFLFKKRHTNNKILEMAQVRRGKITAFVEETGIVKTQVGALVKVGTRATGELVYLPFKVGDYVKKGQLLARIDDREFKANLHRAIAKLKSAEANLRLIEETYPLRIKEQQARLAAARARYDYALEDLRREEELLKKEFTTQDAVDRARREKKVASAEYELEKRALLRIKEEYKRKRELALAQIAQAKANVKSWEAIISYTRIYAPISGYIAQVSTQQGETVVAGLTAPNLITILDPTKLEVWIYVDETDIGRVKPGDEVVYYVDAYPDKQFRGRIATIYPQPEIKENIVYYLAIVKVRPEDTRFIRPQMTVHTKIITDKKEGALLVPNEAIKFEGGRTIVYRIDGKRIVPTKVDLGLRGERETEIVQGLKEGDKIAVKFSRG